MKKKREEREKLKIMSQKENNSYKGIGGKKWCLTWMNGLNKLNKCASLLHRNYKKTFNQSSKVHSVFMKL